MSTDIKLEETNVVVEAAALACKTTDLMLDHPDRRKQSGGYRRALVHNYDDGLTLNWADDYPDGVTIEGKVHVATIAPKGIVLKVETADFELDRADRRKNTTAHRRALVHNSDDGLTLNWGGDYPDGVTIEGKVRASTIAPKGIGLKVETADFELERADRRKNMTAHRRALVHNFDDGLTINWQKDYPGGVTIQGPLKTEEVESTKLKVANLTCAGPLKAEDVQATKLVVGGVSVFNGTGVAATAREVQHSHKLFIYSDTIKLETSCVGASPIVTTLDLVAEIKALRSEVNALKSEVAALRGK